MGFKSGKDWNGNAGGRKAMSDSVRKLLEKGAEEAISGIIELSKSAQSEKVRLAAMEYLVDRVYGKAVQPVGNETEEKAFKIQVL